ncbi:DMT family transporter [Dinoroseobacter sp. S375]|uniref:DMT family transporter n=1 Tax=Dinoroseobacter sp. S375 TaxID=3415136 RepID=UPI003C7CD78D
MAAAAPRTRLWLTGLLVVLGAGWGITQPLAKIAVSTGYGHFGLIFWQFVVGVVVLGAVTLVRGKRLPCGPKQLRLYVIIAVIGTLLPNSASFAAIVHLPSGITSILLSLVPMLAFPIALALGLDRFSLKRIAGLSFGLGGVALIVLPGSALPDAAMLVWVPVALFAPLFYALEGNVVAKWGTYGVDAVQVLLGASLVGVVLALPFTLLSGQWIDPRPPWGAADAALVASATIHGIVYSCYVWLVGRAGPVFAAQVSYLVTGFGLFWAMLILGERYSGPVWAATALMMVGLFLVTPRANSSLASKPDAPHSKAAAPPPPAAGQ